MTVATLSAQEETVNRETVAIDFRVPDPPASELQRPCKQFCAVPVKALGNENGQVSGLRLAHTEIGLPDSGRRPYLTQSGTEFDIEAVWVISALGFDPLPCPRTMNVKHRI